MVTLHLHCEAKYLIRFYFTRGGPVILNVSKSDVELPSFFRSFFLKGKPDLGLNLENWTWVCKTLFMEMIWLVRGILCPGAVPKRCGEGQLF